MKTKQSRSIATRLGHAGTLIACAMLAACSSQSGVALDVHVVDGVSQSPIAAAVTVSRSDPHHPLDLVAAIMPDDTGSHTWKTDKAGIAHIQVLKGRPQTVAAWAAGYLPESRFIDGTEAVPLILRLSPAQTPQSPR